MKKRAFTLVELLVVIAIIALLMALLMPALRLARDQATALLCVNNIKQLSMAWFSYTVDNDGSLVCGHRYRGNAYSNISAFPDGFWINPPHDATGNYTGEPGTLDDKLRGIRTGKLFPYVKSEKLFHCRGDAREEIPEQLAYCSYAIAGGMNGEPAYSGSSGKQNPDRVAEVYDEIRNPANKYVFIEESDPRGWNMGSWILNPTGTCWIDPLAPWHNYWSTLGFADSHAEKHRWRSKNTNRMNVEQIHGYCPNPNDSDKDDEVDLYYMQRGYVSGKNQ
jgi:prepilin-type N-terminal cleavage/methylation domain-containing protein